MINHTVVYADHIENSEALEFHTFDEFQKLEKFIGNDNVDFRTTYSKDGSEFKVHAHAYHNGTELSATAVSNDMYKSIDLMVSKLESQLRTEKGKRININRDINVVVEEDIDENS